MSTIRSRALRVHPSQVDAANAAAREMGCGEPFGRNGMFEASRGRTKRYVDELNKRRVDAGQPRIVNYDAGYGDPS